jgi:hypothetical protein
MKFAAASTLFFATLALASPAPAAQPNAAAVAQPEAVALPHEFVARNLPILESRAKKPKGGSSGNNSNDTGAAVAISPSRALQLGALSLGVYEIVRLW